MGGFAVHMRQGDKKYSVKTVILITVSLLLIASIAISMIFVSAQGRKIKDANIQFYSSNIKNIENNLMRHLSEMYYRAKLFSDEKLVRNFAESGFSGVSEVKTKAEKLFVENGCMDAVFFLLNDGQTYALSNNEIKTNSMYFADIVENIESFGLLGVIGTDNKKVVFTIPLFNTDYTEEIGHIVFIFSDELFKEEIGLFLGIDFSNYVIAHNSTPIEVIGGKGYIDLPENWLSHNYDAGEYCFERFESSGQEHYATQFTIERYGIIVYFVIPITDIDYQPPIYLWFATGLFALVLIFVVVLVIRLLVLMSNSLSSVDSMLENIERFDEKLLGDAVSIKEFYYVAERVCAVSNKIARLNYERLDAQRQSLQKEVAKRNALLAALKNQINPHFFYNTLACVKQLSLNNNNNAVALICDKMVQILRYSIKNSDTAKVYEEIEALESYLQIQNFRFEQEIFYKMDIDESIMECDIPRFMLQPVLENSIMHGILPENTGGKLTVSGLKDNGKIVFRISDNGTGMSPEKLEKLQEKLSRTVGDSKLADEENGHGIGLANINRRIKLFYSDEYGIKIKSILNVGTFVTIEIPLNIEKKEGGSGAEGSDNR